MEATLNRKKKINIGRILFIVLMLAYPVLQFTLFFGYVNINTVFLTFQRFDWASGGPIFKGFVNYKTLFDRILHHATTQKMLLNSLLYMPITCFVILPLSLLFSYFLYKKVPLSGFFRVVYFLPSILPIVVLTMVFSFLFDSSYGPINALIKGLYDLLNINQVPPSYFGEYPTNQIMIFIYCIWVGLGFNIILLTTAITRIPEEVIEYGKISGIKLHQEFFHVVVPMIWPTITSIFMLGITSVFTVLMQPMLLTPSSSDTYTISLIVYDSVNTGGDVYYTATLGLVATLIGLPLILTTKKLLSSCFKGVDY
ncbi:MAG: sugar ABC transporter permease [Bacillales bacterium]|jgi:ABC-type sugar transport system permease subunit|nr:sugar ABC transporter permease [Bacillales bacterium]